MLVLTRRTSDQILIPSLGITLEVLSIKGNVVKLGINAPQEVRILRGELEGIEPGLKRTRPAVEPKNCEASKPSNSLRAYLQRTEKPEAASNVSSRSAVIPILSLSEESSEIIRETATTYEVCT